MNLYPERDDIVNSHIEADQTRYHQTRYVAWFCHGVSQDKVPDSKMLTLSLPILLMSF